jgi:hypothetical protein
MPPAIATTTVIRSFRNASRNRVDHRQGPGGDGGAGPGPLHNVQNLLIPGHYQAVTGRGPDQLPARHCHRTYGEGQQEAQDGRQAELASGDGQRSREQEVTNPAGP